MQFTTRQASRSLSSWLFQRAKIQDFRCNSQPLNFESKIIGGCFKEQRYKILDAIHNLRFFIIKRCRFFTKQCHFSKKQHSKIGCPILFRTAFCFGGRKKEVSRKSRKTSLNRAVARFRGG